VSGTVARVRMFAGPNGSGKTTVKECRLGMAREREETQLNELRPFLPRKGTG
jgi:ABC-type branched-subunit amino acid transport system ATPase component